MGFSCCPYHRGIRYNRVSTRRELIVQDFNEHFVTSKGVENLIENKEPKYTNPRGWRKDKAIFTSAWHNFVRFFVFIVLLNNTLNSIPQYPCQTLQSQSWEDSQRFHLHLPTKLDLWTSASGPRLDSLFPRSRVYRPQGAWRSRAQRHLSKGQDSH